MSELVVCSNRNTRKFWKYVWWYYINSFLIWNLTLVNDCIFLIGNGRLFQAGVKKAFVILPLWPRRSGSGIFKFERARVVGPVHSCASLYDASLFQASTETIRFFRSSTDGKFSFFLMAVMFDSPWLHECQRSLRFEGQKVRISSQREDKLIRCC